MKFLLCGCFHGKVPRNLISAAKKEKVNYILSTGDFYNYDYFRRLIFRYPKETQGADEALKKIIGRKKYYKLLRKFNLSGIKTLKRLNSINIPILTAYGNNDDSDKAPWHEYKDKKKKSLDFQIKKFKNIKLIDYDFKKINDYFIYFVGVKFPRKSKKSSYKGFSPYKVGLEEAKKLNKFFKKVNPRKVILISHEPPLNTKFDKVINKESFHNNEHVGDYVIKDVIKKYKPFIHVSGHMHEHQGKLYLGRTLLISHGSAQFGKFALLELENNKIKKLKFYK